MVRRLFALAVVFGGVAALADQLTPTAAGIEPAGPVVGPPAGWAKWARALAHRVASL